MCWENKEIPTKCSLFLKVHWIYTEHLDILEKVKCSHFICQILRGNSKVTCDMERVLAFI